MNQVIQVDVTAVAFIAGTIIPLLTALLTKARASSRVKSACTLVLSLATGVTAYLTLHDGRTTWQGLVTAAVGVYLAAGTTYQNAWKPLGTAAAVANLAPDAGLGEPVPLDEQPAEPVTAIVSQVAPNPTESAQVTTLKGQPVYADAGGYLFVPK